VLQLDVLEDRVTPTISFAAPVDHVCQVTDMRTAGADFNGDGKPDVAVTSGPTPGVLSVFFNTGTGGLSSTPLTLSPGVGEPWLAIRAADITGDGIPDILMGGEFDDEVSIIVSKGNGTFQPPVLVNVPGPNGGISSLAVADVNGDTRPDLAVMTYDHGLDGLAAPPGR
jgi:hypothetical protein